MWAVVILPFWGGIQFLDQATLVSSVPICFLPDCQSLILYRTTLVAYLTGFSRFPTCLSANVTHCVSSSTPTYHETHLHFTLLHPYVLINSAYCIEDRKASKGTVSVSLREKVQRTTVKLVSQSLTMTKVCRDLLASTQLKTMKSKGQTITKLLG